MPHSPILTTVVGSYPFPGWLEHVAEAGPRFGPDDVAEVHDDAVTVAVMDQVRAGLDVITDGEQSRFDFNLSFYVYFEGIERDTATTRRYGPPAHDQRGSTPSPASLPPRAGSVSSRSISASSGLHPQGHVSRRAFPARTRCRAGSTPMATIPTDMQSLKRCCRSCVTSWCGSSTPAAVWSPSMSRR